MIEPKYKVKPSTITSKETEEYVCGRLSYDPFKDILNFANYVRSRINEK